GATAGIAGGTGRSCSFQPASSQPFTAWNDSHYYFLAPGGDMESGFSAAAWWLSGGAAHVPGSESFDATGNASDGMSLRLPAGAYALSPQLCVTIQDPELRLFARHTGD